MKTSKSEYIKMLREKFEQARKDGLTIDFKMIDGYLDQVQKLAETDSMFDPVAIASIQGEQAFAVAKAQLKSASDLELLRSAISTSIEAYKSSLLMNGGAAVALLAFIGHAVSVKNASFVTGLAGPLGLFVTGALFAALTAGAAYITQAHFAAGARKYKRRGARWRVVAVALTVLSYLCFAIGCWFAYSVFSGRSLASF